MESRRDRAGSCATAGSVLADGSSSGEQPASGGRVHDAFNSSRRTKREARESTASLGGRISSGAWEPGCRASRYGPSSAATAVDSSSAGIRGISQAGERLFKSVAEAGK